MPRIGSVLLYLVPLSIIASLGLTHVDDPLNGDTAVYLVGAKALAKGDVLYVDYWCNKQPGIYWFYLTAGKLFGFTERGLHTFELIFLLVFAIVMIRTLAPYFENSYLAGLAPVATIGVYYATVGVGTLTQPEMLATFSIFLSLWLSSRLADSSIKNRWIMFFSGVFAAVSVLFKLMFAPILVSFWLVSCVIFYRTHGLKPKRLIRERLIPAGLGVCLILGIVVLWFWRNGAVKELLWVSFVWPVKVLAEIKPAPFSRLSASVYSLLKIYGVWMGLFLFSLLRWRKAKREILTYLFLAWVMMGSIIILLQRYSWWDYQFLLLSVPVGILGVRGLDSLLSICLEKHRGVLVPRCLMIGLIILFAFSPSLWVLRRQFKIWASARPFAGREHRQAYQFSKSPQYERIWKDTRFLVSGESMPGSIYVFGNPLYLLLSGREYAIPPQGWAWEGYVQDQWDKLEAWLAQASPPYLYLENYEELIERKSPATIKWIDDSYEVLEKSRNGTWYRLKMQTESSGGDR